MTFILAAQRKSYEEMRANWRRYEEYLGSVRDRFPPSAYALATSDWYYNPEDHRCPHDAWLEELGITEPAEGPRHENRTVAIQVRLLGAYHDGHIEMRYPTVFRYELALGSGRQGHGDWRYDEFRLSEEGHILHEIEWARLDHTARWLIEASDVEFVWKPLVEDTDAGPT
jgi:hypothetical protein